jgi:hypothetical protein
MPHRLLQALVVVGAALAATPTRAADAVALSSSEADLVHFAFASQLGSGLSVFRIVFGSAF